MEINLQRDSISYYSKVLSIEFSQEETAETIVPDTLPDIGTVLDADATAILRGKDISDGRITVNGMIFGYIMYRSEGERELRKMPVQLPFSAHWDNSSIGQSSKSIIKLSLSSFEGRIINSRKLLLRADVVISVDVYNGELCEFTTGAECEKLEFLNDQLRFSHISAVGERQFNISEEPQLPIGKPPVESIVKYRVRLCCDEVKAVGSRLVLKGNALVSVLYRAADNEGLCSIDIQLPFSQIYDTECSIEIIAADAVLMLTGCFVDAGSYDGMPTNTLRVDITAAAQFCAWSESEINCLCDAYSTQNDISMSLSDSKLKESMPPENREESFADTLSISGNIKNIIDCYTYIGRQRTESGSYIWPVSANVLYEDENGEAHSAEGNFEIRYMDAHSASDCCAEILSISAKAAPGGLEVKLAARYTLHTEDEIAFATPAEITVDEESVKDYSSQPSIVVLKADGITSLWSIAKSYNTTTAAICEANPELACNIPSKGALLLIAKKR